MHIRILFPANTFGVVKTVVPSWGVGRKFACARD